MKMMTAAAVAIFALAAPAFAETKSVTKDQATSERSPFYVATEKNEFHASSLIGSTVYATTADFDVDKPIDKVGEDWENIGEINNIVIERDGDVKAVVLGVGGFLSLGEKNVAVKMSELKFVKKAGDDSDDFFVVLKGDKALLEKAPEYEIKD